jgi:hypothetical protein
MNDSNESDKKTSTLPKQKHNIDLFAAKTQSDAISKITNIVITRALSASNGSNLKA